jgi:cathepsin B
VLAAELNAQPGSWRAGLNSKFFNMTVREAQRLMGARRDPARRAALPVVSYVAASIPAHFNATQAWPQCAGVIGHIRDQSDCGSCWAVSSSGAFNDRLCVATNATTELSSQDTTSCCNADNGYSSGGCDGGFTEDAFNYFAKTGLVSGGESPDKGKGTSCFPYQLAECGHHEASPLIPCPQVCSPGECATPVCPTKCSEATYGTAWKADKRKAAKGAYRLASVAAAQTDIMTHGSIAAAFTVYADFLTYTSGVYTHKSGAELGGHAVRLYGSSACKCVPPTTPRGKHPHSPPPPPTSRSTHRLGHDCRGRGLLAGGQQLEQGACFAAPRSKALALGFSSHPPPPLLRPPLPLSQYWGADGSFMIARGTDECGFEDDLVAGTAA